MLGLSAWSGTGKTTLLRQLIPRLREHGLCIAAIKVTHHDFEVDHPGKDSHALRAAGAVETLLASPTRWALIHEHAQPREPDLFELAGKLDRDAIDLVLVEGFRRWPFPRIELHRPSLGKPLLHPDDPHIIALASDHPVTPARALPVLDLNDIDAIAGFILDWMKGQNPNHQLVQHAQP